jgi:hypothetical protein
MPPEHVDVAWEVGLVAAGDPEPVDRRRVARGELVVAGQDGDDRAVGYRDRSGVLQGTDQVHPGCAARVVDCEAAPVKDRAGHVRAIGVLATRPDALQPHRGVQHDGLEV